MEGHYPVALGASQVKVFPKKKCESGNTYEDFENKTSLC